MKSLLSFFDKFKGKNNDQGKRKNPYSESNLSQIHQIQAKNRDDISSPVESLSHNDLSDSSAHTSDSNNSGNAEKSVQPILPAQTSAGAKSAVREVKFQTKQAPHAPGRRVYADYASLTPIDPRVKKVMIEAMDLYTANPSSLYTEGVKAKKALEEARTSVAAFFGVSKDEVIFTSGGTESNNLAFRGMVSACKKVVAKPHFIISTIEHPSIIEIALQLMEEGLEVSFVPVNEKGLVDPKDIKKALRPETVLVSVMYANNEIGTVQPIKEITREVRHYKKSLGRENGDYPYVHTDACQAVLYEDMRIPGLNIDLLTIDGGKVYGPRGCGVLVKKRYVKLGTLMQGGGQENGLRPGTENLTSILGLKHALDIVHNEKEEESNRLLELRQTLQDMLFAKLSENFPNMKINGDLEQRLPNNVNICFPELDAEFLVLRLDVLGIAVSSVTSCRANDEDSSSYVIEALGRPDCSLSSLRITLGRYTTVTDIAYIAEMVAQAVGEQVEK